MAAKLTFKKSGEIENWKVEVKYENGGSSVYHGTAARGMFILASRVVHHRGISFREALLSVANNP